MTPDENAYDRYVKRTWNKQMEAYQRDRSAPNPVLTPVWRPPLTFEEWREQDLRKAT
jgi:hypothetical protein